MTDRPSEDARDDATAHASAAPRPARPASPDVWRLVLGDQAPRDVSLTDLAALADLHEQPVTGGLPHVRANMVSTVDGAATAAGLTAAISPAADRTLFRVLRATADAVLVGAGTARAENYGPITVPDSLMAWRAERGLAPLPVLVQVTRSGKVHEGRGVFVVPGSSAVVTSSRDPAVLEHLAALAGTGHVIQAAPETGSGAGVDVPTMLRGMAARGWRRVLCEGGPSLLGDLIRARAVDELCLTTSPALLPTTAPRITLGDTDARPAPVTLSTLAVAGSTVFARWSTA